MLNVKNWLRRAVLLTLLLKSSCISSTIYQPDIEYTEVEVNIVFDSEGFRGINGWIWQVGTLVYSYDRYGGFSISGWPEEIDNLEENLFLIDLFRTEN